MNNSDIQLKKLRLHLRMTQDEFAERINTKRNNISMIESGRNKPTFDMIGEIQKAFGISADYFLTEAEPDTYISEKAILNNNNVNNNDNVNYIDNDNVIYKNDVFRSEMSDVDVLTKLQQNARKINRLWQRLVDIRILLFQELNIQTLEQTKQQEVILLWDLSRPSDYTIEGQNYFGYKYEKLNLAGKIDFLKQQESCIELYTETFFELFSQFYKGVIIPLTPELRKEFFAKRIEQTNNWSYSHYIQSK